MNRPETALAALLFCVVIVAPASAQQAPLTPAPAVSDEFCSGCFAYLEFPPLPQAEAASTLASTHQDAKAAPTAARENPIVSLTPGVVASIKQ